MIRPRYRCRKGSGAMQKTLKPPSGPILIPRPFTPFTLVRTHTSSHSCTKSQRSDPKRTQCQDEGKDRDNQSPKKAICSPQGSTGLVSSLLPLVLHHPCLEHLLPSAWCTGPHPGENCWAMSWPLSLQILLLLPLPGSPLGFLWLRSVHQCLSPH